MPIPSLHVEDRVALDKTAASTSKQGTGTPDKEPKGTKNGSRTTRAAVADGLKSPPAEFEKGWPGWGQNTECKVVGGPSNASNDLIGHTATPVTSTTTTRGCPSKTSDDSITTTVVTTPAPQRNIESRDNADDRVTPISVCANSEALQDKTDDVTDEGPLAPPPKLPRVLRGKGLPEKGPPKQPAPHKPASATVPPQNTHVDPKSMAQQGVGDLLQEKSDDIADEATLVQVSKLQGALKEKEPLKKPAPNKPASATVTPQKTHVVAKSVAEQVVGDVEMTVDVDNGDEAAPNKPATATVTLQKTPLVAKSMAEQGVGDILQEKSDDIADEATLAQSSKHQRVRKVKESVKKRSPKKRSPKKRSPKKGRTCNKTLEQVLRGFVPCRKHSDIESVYNEPSAETKGVKRVPKEQRHNIPRCNNEKEYRRKARREMMDNGLQAGIAIRKELKMEKSFEESKQEKKLKPMLASGTIHRMSSRRRVLMPPDERTLTNHSDNCWWQTFLETMRRAFEYMLIPIPSLPPSPTEVWEDLPVVASSTLPVVASISNVGMATMSNVEATTNVEAKSMLGKALALLHSGDIALESTPCKYIDDAMWAVGSHNTGKFSSVEKAFEALHFLTEEDEFLHRACTTEWQESCQDGLRDMIGPMYLNLVKGTKFQDRFDAAMKKRGRKQLPNMIVVEFRDAGQNKVTLDKINHPRIRDLEFNDVKKQYRIVSYIYTDGTHFYPVVLRSQDSKLWCADGMSNDGILQELKVGYQGGVHDILDEEKSFRENERERYNEEYKDSEILGLGVQKFNKACHDASLICEKMFLDKDGNPHTAGGNGCYLSHYVYATRNETLVHDMKMKQDVVEIKRPKKTRPSLNRAFTHSPVLKLRYFAIVQHQTWNNEDIVRLERMLQYRGSGLTQHSKIDVQSRLVAAKLEQEKLALVYGGAHELLGYAKVEEPKTAATKHKCCVCKPLQCLRVVTKRLANKFKRRPYTITEICAGKCLGPFCIVFQFYGHDANGILDRKSFRNKKVTREGKKVVGFHFEDRSSLRKPSTNHEMNLHMLMNSSACAQILRKVSSFLGTPWRDMHDVYNERDANDPWRQTWDPTLNISRNVLGATSVERERFAFSQNHQNWIIASKQRAVLPQYHCGLSLTLMRKEYIGDGSRQQRPMWWGLRFLFTLNRAEPVVGRLIGADAHGYHVVVDDGEDLNWTRCITTYIIGNEGERRIATPTNIPYHQVLLNPELCPEENDTVNVFPTTENVKFKALASMVYRSRYAGHVCLDVVQKLYDTEKLGKALHPNPVINCNTPIPVSPIGNMWCQHFATPVCVEEKKVGSAEIRFAGLMDWAPKMTTGEFLLHDMCRSARLRYTIRLWIYAHMCNASIAKTEEAIKNKMKEMNTNKQGLVSFFQKTTLYTGQPQRGVKENNSKDAWKRPFFAYYSQQNRVNLMMILKVQLGRFLDNIDYAIDGVSEQTFNQFYHNQLPANKLCMFNDWMLVNSFHKKNNDLTWAVSGAKTDMITLQFASCNGTEVPSTTTMAIFKDQHKHDPDLVRYVEDWAMCKTWEKQGSRVCPILVNDCILDRKEEYKICPTVKGTHHCAQRTIAGALLLTTFAKVNDINTLLLLKGFAQLGADTDAGEINDALGTQAVREWLLKVTGSNYSMSLGDLVKGDAFVRYALSRLQPGNCAVAYPMDLNGATRHCMLMYRPFKEGIKGPVLMWDPSDAIDRDARLAVFSRKNETALRIQEFVGVRHVRFIAPPKRKRLNKHWRKKRQKLRGERGPKSCVRNADQ